MSLRSGVSSAEVEDPTEGGAISLSVWETAQQTALDFQLRKKRPSQ
jgi:hypothetical protein